MLGATKEELQTAIGQLEQAIDNHGEWFEAINRTVLCRLPLDRRDLRVDAHRECRFGQWLYQHACRKLREHPGFAAIEQEHAIMHRDAADMLSNLDECGAISVKRYDRFANSLKRLRLEMNTLLQELQTTLYNLDSLTGANSRIGMLTHLREQRELARRSAQVFSVAMLDLDHFKAINDKYGHQSGDKVLRAVARYILDDIRPYDRLFRYGGEEFLLSMPQTSLDQAWLISERLREGVAELPLTDIEGQPITINVSIGVTEYQPDQDVSELIRQADQSLYHAKKSGRNRTCRWSEAFSDAPTES